jgi:putative DNA primase/helicase
MANDAHDACAAIALRLVDRLIPDWRYVAARKTWLFWDGVCWQSDESGMRQLLQARDVCCATAYRIGDPDRAREVSSYDTISRVAYLARGDPRVAASHDVWDADPWLLNTPGGIVDLRTGESMPHQRSKLMTGLAGAAPEGVCPDWLRFLDELTGGDLANQNYLQHLVGYSLTGSTKERVVPYLWGPGLGKSLFLRTLRLLHGTYGTAAALDCFSARSRDNQPTGVATFSGKRLVVATSIDEETSQWNEQRLEALTGGDPVVARTMGGEFFYYRARLKLMLHGTFASQMEGLDRMRARLHLLPFRHQPAKIDRHLTDKFKAQLGGIMAWAVEGAVSWWQHGLPPPPAASE